MYKPIPANGTQMNALSEMLEEHGLQAILESLEVLARERLTDEHSSDYTRQLWAEAARQLERTYHLYCIAAL